MKKKLIAASMAAAMTLSLAACGGSGASSTASAGDTASTAASTEAASGDEQINLRMAWWGSQDRHDKTRWTCAVCPTRVASGPLT